MKVGVKHGTVVLAGQPGELEHPDLVAIAVRLTREVEGVVDVVDKLCVGPHG